MRILVLFAASLAHAQESGLSARELFYVPKAPASAVQPPPQAAPPVAKKTAPKGKQAGGETKPPVSIAVGAVEVTAPSVIPVKAAQPVLATMSVVQVDEAVADCRDRGAARPEARWANVPENTVFRPGQRIRLVLQANTGGFIYMFARQSSGAFEDLYPLMRDMSAGNWKPVQSYQEAALPALCVTEQKGESAENEIWVLVTRDERRAVEFRDSIRNQERQQGAVYAMNNVESALKRANADLASRDIVRDDDPEPAREGAPANAVYRKSSSQSGDQVFSIKLRQQ